MIGTFWRHLTKNRVLARSDLDLSQKTFIVTGANTGIGYTTARSLAKMNANVIMACRSEMKAKKAIQMIKKEHKAARVTFSKLDLSSLSSIDSFCEGLGDKSIDVLVNNAGVCELDESIKLSSGFELMFQVNCLGTYYLTKKLLPKLRYKGRVVVVSACSVFNLYEKFVTKRAVEEFAKHPVPVKKSLFSVGFVTDGDSFHQYSVTKLLMIHLTLHLHDVHNEGENGISFNLLHPGLILTEFGRKRKNQEVTATEGVGLVLQDFSENKKKSPVSNKLDREWTDRKGGFTSLSWEKGCQTTVFVASDPLLKGVSGKFFDNCNEIKLSKLALDLEYRNRVVQFVENILKMRKVEKMKLEF